MSIREKALNFYKSHRKLSICIASVCVYLVVTMVLSIFLVPGNGESKDTTRPMKDISNLDVLELGFRTSAVVSEDHGTIGGKDRLAYLAVGDAKISVDLRAAEFVEPKTVRVPIPKVANFRIDYSDPDTRVHDVDDAKLKMSYEEQADMIAKARDMAEQNINKSANSPYFIELAKEQAERILKGTYFVSKGVDVDIEWVD